jgi:threonylcarbamoyladenosine tRNA methylthiotransferase MtaB
MQVWIKTFGCKVNYAESVGAAAQLVQSGHGAVAEWDADAAAEASPGSVVAINSCCVTREAERKVLQFVRRVRRQWPGLRVVVTGCGARHGEISERYRAAGAEVLAGFGALAELLGTAEPLAEQDAAALAAAAAATPRTRAFIKIQDGCTCRCAYCIIPQVRPYTSVPLETVLTQVRTQLGAGVRELVLTGINTGHWGRAPFPDGSRDGRGLPWLVAQVLTALPPGTRLRLSGVEPEDAGPELLALFANPQLCPHLHLPLQSGSDAVLRAMGRRYTVAEYLQVVADFRRCQPWGAVTTDVMAGFPGESEDDFAATLATCTAAGFERVHGFPFSPRPGTRAAELELLPRATRQERNRRLVAHCAALTAARWERHTGRREQVLLEEQQPDGSWHGYGRAYQPVSIASATGLTAGQLVEVVLREHYNGWFSAVALR